ncbi:MAG: transpeptidase family protein [Acidobacteria bacterium]|nr:transpeptidase family protein [Acidobacteriota bacterium]
MQNSGNQHEWGSDPQKHEGSAKRIRLLVRIALFWAVVIVVRLFYLQIYSHDEYREIAQSQQQRVLTVAARRGKILDRNDEELAMSTAVKSVCVNPQFITDPEVSSVLMAEILGMGATELCARIQKAKDAGRGYMVVKPRINTDEFQRLSNLKIKGIEFRDESFRSYPKGQVAAHVLGCTDREEKGCGGIELGLDEELEGLPGAVRQLKDVTNRGYASEEESKPQPGKNVWLTIDERVQFVAEKYLAAAAEGCNCKTGSVVVMDPSNGDILAMASFPTFNPNEHVKDKSEMAARLNQAVAAPFEPGSVFKIFTLAAALETTQLGPESPVNCLGGTINLFGRVIHEAKRGYGVMPMRMVLSKSSNVGAIQVGLQVGVKNLHSYIKAFGFGKRTGLPLPAESGGRVYEPRKWGATSMGSVAIGHEVTVTTLQLAQAVSVVANNGMLVKPRIVLKRQRPGEPMEFEPVAEPVKVLETRNAFRMRDMMHDVVLPGGTGFPAASIAGFLVGGKTGSAQMFDHDKGVYTHKYNASFVGMAPLTRPRIVVVVTLNGSSLYGGVVAAPVFKQIASAALRILDVPKDQELPVTETPARRSDDDAVDVADAPKQPTMIEVNEPLQTAELRMPEGLDAVRTPNLMGKSVRDVVTETSAAGLLVEVHGSGVSRKQKPAPGAPLPRGERIVVEFRR